jgi:methionine aminotransferase
MHKPIVSKLPNIGTTIFTRMTQLATEQGALNLSQGFPDFPISDELIGLVNKYMKLGYNQYAPMAGVESLRKAVSDKLLIMHGCSFDPASEITITAGATQALFTAISAVIKNGDEVIIFEPAFDTYAPAVELCGGKPVYISLYPPDYKIDWNEVKAKISSSTRMIIINTPHNPTGQVWSKEDMLNLQSLLEDTDIFVLSDEVYDNLIFNNINHQSPCAFPELKNRSFIVGSFGKMFHVTGWKTGYCAAPSDLMHEFRKAHQQIVFACNHPLQMALSEYMQEPDNYLHLNDFYMQKRDYFGELLKNSRFKLIPTYGTYFQLLDYSNISDMPETDYAVFLTKEYKIAPIPVSVFYHDNRDFKVLRVCFAKQNSTLEKAAEILCRI